MSLAVAVQSVSKRFRLHHERYNSLKEKIIHAGRVPYEDLWALSNVSFEVKEGQTVGILGRNGSGKSTLLKCVCGVLQPTSGQVVVRGKLAGLLELGAGFQQDLSGRDNVYLNGSMLGLSRREVDRVFDDIVAFAELEQFIDNQVKFYSSGMYVRLGFAVAVNVDPDVLVIDEVLAVGDERFQRKCIDRVKKFQREGRTILLVTHSPDQVRSICDWAVVLSNGAMIGQGPPGEAVRLFRETLMEADDVLSVNATAPPGLEPQGSPEPPATDGVAPVAPPGMLPPSPPAAPGLPTPPPRIVPPSPTARPPARSASGALQPTIGSIGSGEIFTGPPSGATALAPSASHPVRLRGVDVEYPGSDSERFVRSGESLRIRLAFDSYQATDDVAFVVELRDDESNLVARVDTDLMGETFRVPSGPGALAITFTSVPMLDGTFEISAGAQSHGGVLYDWWQDASHFEVMNPTRNTGRIAIATTAQLLTGEAVGSAGGLST